MIVNESNSNFNINSTNVCHWWIINKIPTTYLISFFVFSFSDLREEEEEEKRPALPAKKKLLRCQSDTSLIVQSHQKKEVCILEKLNICQKQNSCKIIKGTICTLTNQNEHKLIYVKIIQ